MKDPDELSKEVFQRMPLEADLLHSQKIGQVVLDNFEHDPFIDGLQGHLKDYPEDAP